MKTKLKSILLLGVLFVFYVQISAQENNFYKSRWLQIDTLETKGLPKSALKLVNEIFVKAKADSNSEQLIKSFIYRLKYRNSIEENAFESLCFELDSVVKTTSFPDNAIMHSMLADMYWWYYQNNRYKFYKRSNTVNFDNRDMQTWTLDALVNKIINEHQSALKNKQDLQKLKVEKYKELIQFGSRPKELRPTLFDFLAHKALDFYSNTEIALTKPADYFELREDFYFADATKFAMQNIQSSDTLSLHFHSVKLFQELFAFRLQNESEQNAMIALDLRRLQFVNQHSVNNNKNGLYIQSLKRLEKDYQSNAYVAEVKSAIAKYYYRFASYYNPLQKETDKYKSYKKTAHDICSNVIEKYPKSNAARHCATLLATIKTRNINFSLESIVAADQKFSTKVNYANTTKLFVRVAKLDKNFYKNLRKKKHGKELYDKIKRSAKIIYESSHELPVDEDYNTHSVELVLNKLPAGFYMLFISDNEGFSYNKALASYKEFYVSGMSYITQKTFDGSQRFLVLDRSTGMPIPGVSCQSWYNKYSYAKRKYVRKNGSIYKTDKNGSIILKYVKSARSESWKVDFSLANDFLTTESSYYISEHNNYTYSRTKTTFFTDRAIYRPGQTIYFKGIKIRSLKDKHEIVTNSATRVYLYDVNNQKVSELDVKTNEFGTFSGTFDIPLGLLNGVFTIKTASNSSKTISVEEYKRPKFEVEMLPFKGNYLLNDAIEVSGKAVSYSGAALSDASVKYRIIRTPLWRGWWHWNYRSASVEIKNGVLKSDDDGHFKIKFKALPDLSLGESEYLSFNYSIKVDVTDLNGETQSTADNIYIGYRALEVALRIDPLINKNNKSYLDKKRSKIKITTQNLNYEFIPAKGDIKIFKLKDVPTALRSRHWKRPDKSLYSKEEWYKLFPGNLYSNENEKQQLEKGKQVFTSQFDTKVDKKLDVSFLKDFETGQYVAEIYSVDAFGNKVSNKHFFNVYSDEAATMPYPEIGLFVPVKNYCEPGEEASFLVGSSKGPLSVMYQVEHKGVIVSSEFISINKGQKIIKIPVEEKHRGNFSVHFVFVKDNRMYNYNAVVYVPYSNKRLDIEFETFRDKLLPGEKEQWRIKIKGPKGDKVAAEMLASLYDASLDQFKKNYWDFSIFNSYYTNRSWGSGTFNQQYSILHKSNIDYIPYASVLTYNRFNWFGFSYYRYSYLGANKYYLSKERTTGNRKRRGSFSIKSKAKRIYAPSVSGEVLAVVNDESPVEDGLLVDAKDKSKIVGLSDLEKQDQSSDDLTEVKVRTNFNETAFFYPHLKTNAEGEVIVEFTVPESLTKWKMMGFATTADLKYGSITNELVTQKDLMLLPNEPRFFRENDKFVFPVKISNISEKDLSGKVKLEFFDAITMKAVKGIFAKRENETKDFTVNANKNALVSWNLEIPEGLGAIMYKVVAKAGDFSDGEQKPIPVLTNRMLVTESMPLPVRANQSKTFNFGKLINSGESTTLRHHKLTLEFTSNPAWYAIQSLPYLFEYPYECTEQTFSRFYANTIASHIANSNPKVKRVFDSWKNTPKSGALLSNLEKNQELKAVLLEETPWVLDGKNESERKNRVGLLFDLNRMSNELERALKKVQKAQKINGAWPWFDGMPESRYITQHIVTGMGHLDKLGIKSIKEDKRTWRMITNAVKYLDIRIKEDYKWLKKHYSKKELQEDHLSYMAVHYLYGRSYFTNIKIPEKSKEAYEYFKGQAEKYWLKRGKYMQAMIALSLHRYETKNIPEAIVKSLKENSISHEELGMYWKDNVAGWYWYQAPIETQALMIETFSEVLNDMESVNDMKIWLLKQKQTQDWKTTKATTEAVYALLKQGSDWLESDELAEIKMGNKLIDPTKMDDVKVEAGTGYFKTSWSGEDIKPNMGKVTVTKKNEGIAWGAVYWQYFEQLDKITPHETPLKLKKQLFIEKLTERGKVIEAISDKNQPKIGDKVIVRIELRVDRRMEYIHMKDMRASGFEPINVISRYKWQDGLGYYESTKDAATNFFMEALPKGTFVFEYPLRVTHKGDFSNGVTTIQCMYAPEFTSHSEGIRVNVEN